MVHLTLRVILTISTLLFFSMACQPVDPKEQPKSGQPAAQSPLNSKQTNAFIALVDSLGRIESAALDAKGLTTTPAVSDPLQAEIKDALVKGECVIDYKDDPNTVGVRNSYLKVGGAKCPLSVNFESRYRPGTPNGQFSMIATYSISDPTLRAKNDIYDLALSGNGTFNVSNIDGSVNLNASGIAQSAAMGRIQIYMKHLEKQNYAQGALTSNGTQSFTFNFPKSGNENAFTVELKALISIQRDQDQTRYYKNNIDISKEEYQGYLRKFGIMFN